MPDDQTLLLQAVALAHAARQRGNHPFGGCSPTLTGPGTPRRPWSGGRARASAVTH